MIYPRPLQAIHWIVATLVTCQLAIAVVLSQLRSLAYGQHILGLHRQLGLIILLLVVARFVVGRTHKPPSPTTQLPSWQTRAAVIVHRLFFGLLVVQPVLGILLAWARGDGVSLFGLPDIPAPWEISDTARERLMTMHAAVALLLFGLCVVHIGAVVFNRVVRRVSVIDRMLPASAADRLVNRVPIAAQLTLAFGLVVIMALMMGINATATYRQFNKVSTEFQEGEVAAWDNTRSAQVAWKELLGLAGAGHASENGERLQELADSTRSSVAEALAHTPAGEVEVSLQEMTHRLAGIDAAALPEIGKLREIDAQLQELVDSQGAAAFQHRTENDEHAARGQDLIVVTVLPMMLAGIVAALLLARSVTGSLSRMSTLIRGIESERREGDVSVVGEGEFAAVTREIVSMRVAVEQRSRTAAEQRAEFDAERVRIAEEQQQREVAAERQGRVERQMHRDRMAGEFEMQVAVIVDTVARTAQELTSAAGSMATSASNTTQRSRDASSVADRTSGTASLISQGTQGLSDTARSVRENAEKSQAQAVLAVQEAAAAREQIDRLLAAAKQIGSITDVIAGVARQTNLLAINARIEAARAGEVGRGFSIVANEVKDLANQTRNATHGIGKQIEEVTTAAARSSQSLERLREVIQGLEEAAAAIFTSTAEQFASTRDIAERVAEITSSTRSVAQNIHDARNTASDTEALSEEVARAAAVVDEQARHLREQVAGFVLQLRENATGPASPLPRLAQGSPEAAGPSAPLRVRAAYPG